ncbi:MAG: hypothetical protein EP330_05300 [Deltaproteobacteria bacterium]|nr:MAG: hypothetical protein EP330_05300 [Deltaproteobacteria bacterium]
MSLAAEEARQRLRFHLELQEGFWFALVVGSDREARAELRDDAGALLAVEDFEALEGEEVALAAALTSPRRTLAWVVVEDRRVARALLAAMNERREAYRRSTGAGVVLEGPTWLKAELRNAAPDLFSIRACILEPSPTEDLPLERDATEELPGPVYVPPPRPQPLPVAEAREGINRELQRARSLAERADDSALRARIASLRRAAQGLLDQGWIGEADSIVHELLELVEERAPDELWVLPERATAWEMEGLAERQLGNLDETREAFDRALDAVVTLRGGRPLDGSTASLQEDEARLWWLLGEVAWSSGDLGRAQACLGRALGLREALLEFRGTSGEDLAELREGIARTWSLLADVASAAGRAEDAADAWVAALEIRSDILQLRPNDPEAARALSISLGRVAGVADAEGDAVGALELRRRAWQLAQDLADRHPDHAVAVMEATTARTRLAQLLLDLGRPRSARHHLEAVLDVRQRMARRDPDNIDWIYRYAATLSAMAELALAEDQPEDASAWAQRAVRRLRRLEAEDPDRIIWRLSLHRALALRGEAYFRTGRYPQAARSFAEAASGMQALVATDARPRWLHRLARLRTREGDAWMASDESARAADAWTLALAGAERVDVADLGPYVGLAQLGQVARDEVSARLDELEDEGRLSAGEAASWRAALAAGGV